MFEYWAVWLYVQVGSIAWRFEYLLDRREPTVMYVCVTGLDADRGKWIHVGSASATTGQILRCVRADWRPWEKQAIAAYRHAKQQAKEKP